MVEGGLKFLIYYISIFAGVFLLSFYGFTEVGVSGEFADVPMLDGDDLTLLDSLKFVFDIVVFFFFLQGLTLFGLPAIIGAMFALILNIGLIYVLARLVRGGG